METNSYNYQRIAEAIDYIRLHFREQPDLDKIAKALGFSPFHFQRLFSEWAGVSPKKFLQYTSIEYSKALLREEGATLFTTALETGLSGTGRLHDLFITIEGMTPGEYKNGGQGLTIEFHNQDTLFGHVFIASTEKGICKLVFEDDTAKALKELQSEFPLANCLPATNTRQQTVLDVFSKNHQRLSEIRLHLKGSEFQLKVWKALLSIPLGRLSSYGRIAAEIGQEKASRAVGSAIGDNPIAFLIPCHRVVQSNGNYGEYRWGATRKKMLIGWEAAALESLQNSSH